MQEKKSVRIIIPEGQFEGDCNNCFYAKKKDQDAQGRIFCKAREPGGYNFPHDKAGCKHYESKVIAWIKIIVFLYFIVTAFVVFIQLLH